MLPYEIPIVLSPAILFGYAYGAYPAILWLASRAKPAPVTPPDPAEWPSITISVPVYNEARQIRELLESLVALDYPRDRIQILIISDCSNDGTDEIVREYASRGVELLRVADRRGKTAAEQAAHPHIRGDLVLNTDASIRIKPNAVKALVRWFRDPTVGVATGRDVSVGNDKVEGNKGESGYVGYEMWVRSLETRLGSIVGASGSLYVIRKDLHLTWLPEMLSRDFASALIAHEHGYRSVSVDEAICIVPRTPSLAREYRRKIRTMARGIDTLWYKKALMNPFTHGMFGFMLFSHKLARWLVYLALPIALIALFHLAFESLTARALGIAGLVAGALGLVGILWPKERRVPSIFAIPGFVLTSNVAGLLAWQKAFARERSAVWEPTRRTT